MIQFIMEQIRNTVSGIKQLFSGSPDLQPRLSSISIDEVLAKEQQNQNNNASCLDIELQPSSVGGLEENMKTSETSNLHLERLPSCDVNRRCWICYACEEDEDAPVDDELVNPCGCKGSTKWVHQSCINHWIDEVQRGNASKEIRCPYCRDLFAFEFPNPSLFYKSLNLVDSCYSSACNTITEGSIIGIVSFVVLGYGAQTVFKKQIKEVLLLAQESVDDYFKQICLGMSLQLVVPTSLIFVDAQLSKLEDILAMSTSSASTSDVRPPPAALAEDDGEVDMNHIVGALLFPTIATSIGEGAFWPIFPSQIGRYMAGAASYIIGRSMLKVVYKRKQLSLQCKRKVVNAKRTVPNKGQEVNRNAGPGQERQNIVGTSNHADRSGVIANETDTESNHRNNIASLDTSNDTVRDAKSETTSSRSSETLLQSGGTLARCNGCSKSSTMTGSK